MNNVDLKKVVTGEVRFSFVHLTKPYAKQPGAEEKYSVTILVPKSDFATKQRIDSAIQAAIQEGTPTKWNGVKPPVVATPIYDGDGVRPSDGMPFGDECKGHWVFTASSKTAPEIIDAQKNPIINQSEIYSGMYGRVSVRFFAYNSNGRKGIGAGLGNVQKLRDGEVLGGGRASAQDDFADESVQAPQYQQPQAPQYQQPQFDPITGQPIGGVMGI